MSDTDFEWIPTIHGPCNGQGCRECGHTGEITVRINVEEYAA
ncbi:hypothetical protein [Nocardia sp. NPDC049707]